VANRYWVGGSGTWNTTSTTNWSASPGGPSGASVPTSADSVFFDRTATYTVTMTGALACLDITVSAGTVTFAVGSAPTLGISGSMSLTAATIWGNTGAITFRSTVAGQTITTNGVSIGSAIVFDGVGGEWTLVGALTTTNSITVTNGTFATGIYNLTATSIASNNSNVRTINFGSSSVLCSSPTAINFTNSTNLTFNAGTSTITSAITATTVAFNGGGLAFYNVSFAATTGVAATITGANSFNNLSFAGRTSAGVQSVVFGASQTINGILTVSAGTNATMRNFLRSSTIGTSVTLTCANVSFTDVDFRDITIAGAAAPASGPRLGDCKGNSGITFTAAANKFWNLAGGGNWSGTGWALSGGGAVAVNNFPLAQDTCIFQATGLNSGATITVNASYNIGTIDMSARTANTMTLATGTTAPSIYGNWINGTGTTLTGTGTFTFAGRGAQTITSAGITFTQAFSITSRGGSVTLQDALTTSNILAIPTIEIRLGTLDLASYNLTQSGNSSQGLAIPANFGDAALSLGSGTLTIAAQGLTTFNNPSGCTVSGTGTIRMTSAFAKRFVGGSFAYTNITLDQGGAGALTIAGSNTFSNITNSYNATGAATITLTAGTTQTVSNFTASGRSGSVLTLNSSVAGSTATISKASGIVAVAYMSIQDNIATGGATWRAYTSTDLGNNTGWSITANDAFWWIVGSGTWDSATTSSWSTSPVGVAGATVPATTNDVYFYNSTTYTVTVAIGAACSTLTMLSGVVTFAGLSTSTLTVNRSMILLAGTTWSMAGVITFNSTSSGNTITTGGATISAGIVLDGAAGSWLLGDALTISKAGAGAFTLANGTVDLNGYTLSLTSSTSTFLIAAGTKSIIFDGGVITTNGAGTTAFNNANPIGFTTSAGTGNGVISLTSASTKTFVGGGSTYACAINQGGAGALTISGSNTFSDITNTYVATGATSIVFAASSTQTVAAFTATGAVGNVLTMNSSSTTRATIAYSGVGSITNLDYLSVRDLAFTPGPATNGSTPYVWYLGGNSTNRGNNIGGLFQPSTFVAPATGPIKVYQITNTATTSWTFPADWNSTSNSIHIIGGGGSGATGAVAGSNRAAGGGGGGGGCTVITNYVASPSSTITVAVGSAGSGGGAGGNTSWDSGAFVAGGGQPGSATTTPSSSGGTGGTGAYAGGQGGAGSFGTTASQGYGAGGGGGAGGPNGAGGAGGNGFGSTTAASVAGGGGGGNGGGSAGGNAASAVGGAGGNNFGATGGGTAPGGAGTVGGGGAGNVNTSAGGQGGPGIDILNTIGSGGGRGGAAAAAGGNNTAGVYGGGGAGGGVSTAGTGSAGGNGAQGIIIIAYTPGAGANNSAFLMFCRW